MDRNEFEEKLKQALGDGNEWRKAGQQQAIYELRKVFNAICDAYLAKLDENKE